VTGPTHCVHGPGDCAVSVVWVMVL